jgi:site-specific recombinase XerD
MMRIQKFKVLLYLKRGSTDKRGKTPIMGRITLNNSMTQFSCKISCTAELWNPRSGRLEGKCREAVEVNAKIDKLLLNINSAYNNLLKRNVDFTAQSIKELIQGSMDCQVTLMNMMDRLYADMEKRVGIDRVASSLVHYKQARETLCKFLKSKFKTEDIAFGQLTNLFISDYYEFLITDCKLVSNSTRKYLAILKKACRVAHKEGYTDRLFFANYPLPKIQVGTPRTITPENFKKIRHLEIPMEKDSLILSRDLLLFSCFTGTAYVDTVSVTNDDLVTDEEGFLWLKYYRHKTKALAQIKLLPEAIELIEIYKDENRNTLMPYQNYKTLWDNLRKICKMANSTQMVSPHMGRHYYASIVTLAENVPIDVISKMLGHTSITQTQVYARVSQQKLFEESAKFAEATKDLVLVL